MDTTTLVKAFVNHVLLVVNHARDPQTTVQVVKIKAHYLFYLNPSVLVSVHQVSLICLANVNSVNLHAKLVLTRSAYVKVAME